MRIIFAKVCFFSVLVSLFFMLAAFVLAQTQPNELPLLKPEITSSENLKVFDALWEKISTKYFDPKFNGADWTKMREIYRPKAEKAENRPALLAILKAMLGELKTSHLDLWQTVSSRKINQKFEEDFDRRVDSLQLTYGFTFKKIEGKSVITEVKLGSLAKAKGLKTGWILLSVDGKLISELDFNIGEVYEGRVIDFIFLDTENKENRITLKPDWLIKKPIRVSLLFEQNIGFLKFDEFHRDISKWFQTELQKFISAKGLIIDLRGNHGGYDNEIRKCFEQIFANDIEFGTYIERNGKIKDSKIKGKKDKAFKGKIVVLVDDESFSNAEIFAQLIKETERGKVVGTHTQGFVLNSLTYNLPDDFMIRIAFRDYLSPKGYRIEGKGVAPDFEIPLTIEDILKNRDLALEKALEIIK